MGNNGDFHRKSMSAIDVREFYSDNLVIFTENSEERWDRIKSINPLLCETLMIIFGENAMYMATEIKSDATDKDIIEAVHLNMYGKQIKQRPIVTKKSRLNLD
tara:strand:- start:234 stop:542 length:309 start_codon:yes stop_codon:yes gene_type:complete